MLSSLTGFRTIITGALVAIVPAALQYVAGVDWTHVVSPTWAMIIAGVVQIGMRLITTTPVGTK